MEDGGKLKLEKKFGGVYEERVGMTLNDLIVDSEVSTRLEKERDRLAGEPEAEGYAQAKTYARANEHLAVIDESLKLSRTDMDLYRRRYAMGSIQIETRGMYRDLTRSMRPVDPPGDGQQPVISRTDRKKQQRQAEKAAKSNYESAKENVTTQFVNPQELSTEWFSKHVLKKEIELEKQDGTKQKTTQDGLLQQVMAGNYENLEQLDPVLRNMAAQKYLEKITISGTDSRDPGELINALFNQGGVAALMNPLFRVGLSLLAKGATISRGAFAGCSAADCAEMEDLCNQRIMSSTLYTVAQKDDDNGIGDDELKRNQESQIFIAKTLLAAHLGKLQRVDTNEDTKEKRKTGWRGGMASAFAHCSRVAFTLPGDKKTTDAMCGEEHGLKAGFFKRTAATHKLSKKKKSKEGSELIEKKSKLGTFYGQQGMNVAVGGLGNPGVGGSRGLRKLKNDGSCGHVYMHVDQGDDSAFTGLLVGFESDAPGVMNMTGHRHGMGNPEFASSFGGMRTDEIGDKYGGRVVDLSGYDQKEFEQAMSKLEKRMTDLYEKVQQGDEVAQAELMNISDLLAGKQMTSTQIKNLLDGVPGDFSYKGKLYKTAESCVLAGKVEKAAKENPEELRTPEMIKAVAQDFAENFAKELPDMREKAYNPLVLRGNSIGVLDTLDKTIKAIVSPDAFVDVIRQIEKEEGGAGAMHNFAMYFLQLNAEKKGEVPEFPMSPEQIETTKKQLEKVFAALGERIQTDQLGGLLTGAAKAYTDKGMPLNEASMWLMNSAMLRCGAIDKTTKAMFEKTGVNMSTVWDAEKMTPEEKESFDIYNAMKMMQWEANALLRLEPEKRDQNPFLNAIARRQAKDAAAPQQPTN